MGTVSRSLQFGGSLTLVVAVGAFAETVATSRYVTLDQGLDEATLHRYHHTDQGTRMLPAAWLAALETPEGAEMFMGEKNLKRIGFLLDNVKTDATNPYGWPVGFTVSSPKAGDKVPMAGITCAACHTGQISYKGTEIRIEGGQGMLDSGQFFGGMVKALMATAKEPERKKRFIAAAIEAGYPAQSMEADFNRAAEGRNGVFATANKEDTLEGPGRSDAVGGIVNRVFDQNLMEPANNRRKDAPVSIPHVWDVWRLSWVQSNGFLPGEAAVGRNIGEVLGVFAKVNFVNPQTGELNPEPLRWKTSIQLDGLVWMEETLQGLRAPIWPADILGPIDQVKAERGKQLFTSTCAGCHGIKELPNGVWDVTVPSLKAVGTDPNMVLNWASTLLDGTKLGLGKEVIPPRGLPVVENAIRKQLYVDNNTPLSEQEGDTYFEAACGYKARPLVGVWSTPPFLHNGSVRTLFDLLSDKRPDAFVFGSREFDPVNVGLSEEATENSMMFDSSISGNSNKGHWFTDQVTRPGRIGSRLSDDDKYAIIEFLKSATYDNYPTEKREKPALMACQGDLDWALK